MIFHCFIKMTQTMLDNNSMKLIKKETDQDQIFQLDENKHLKLYFSTVYKQYVLAFCLSSCKNFILHKKSWEKFKTLIPIIEEFFKNHNE